MRFALLPIGTTYATIPKHYELGGKRKRKTINKANEAS